MKYEPNFTIPIYTIKNLRDIRPLMDKKFIMFGTGNIDDWCAYFGRYDSLAGDNTIMCSMPYDTYYFEIIDGLGKQYGNNKVYHDILHFYEHTGKCVDDKVVNRILNISLDYGTNVDYAYNAFMEIYYGMIAEENKANTKLGRSIKMNGIHRLLIDKVSIYEAANECRGQDYISIQNDCLRHNIRRF